MSLPICVGKAVGEKAKQNLAVAHFTLPKIAWLFTLPKIAWLYFTLSQDQKSEIHTPMLDAPKWMIFEEIVT